MRNTRRRYSTASFAVYVEVADRLSLPKATEPPSDPSLGFDAILSRCVGIENHNLHVVSNDTHEKKCLWQTQSEAVKERK